jgi:ArsR family transcriptional regulator
MSEVSRRLERLLTAELGECRAADVERRQAELEELAAGTPLERVEAEASVFAALGSETRLRLVRLLVASEDDLCVCELTLLVDVSDSAVSHALSDLADAGLVERRSEGRWHYYDATPRAEALLGAIDTTREGPA